MSAKERMAAMRQREKEQGLTRITVRVPDTPEAKGKIQKMAAKLTKQHLPAASSRS